MATTRERLTDALAAYLAARDALHGQLLAALGRGKPVNVRVGGRLQAGTVTDTYRDGTFAVRLANREQHVVELTAGLIADNPQLDAVPAMDFKRAEASF